LQLADFERFFSSAERKLIGSAVDQKKTLIEFWTLKEAVCKAAGTGILQDLPEIEFSPAGVPQPSIFHAGKIWQARQFNVGADYAAAIASESLVEVDLHWVQLDGSGLRRT
jgi:phosphopantetheine--protein transferase-like protein